MKRIVDTFDRVVLSAVLLFVIRVYQACFSVFFRGACRFYPSCSNYALEAIGRHGGGRGVWLTVSRLARCHPFHPGGADPVP